MKLSRLGVVLGSILALSVGYRAVDAQIERWSDTASQNNATPPHGFPENMAPSAVNDSARETMAQIHRFARQGVSPHFAPDGGSANVYMISPAILPSATRVSGAVFRFMPANANTGESTLRVGSITPVSIRKISDTVLSADDLQANVMATVIDNGTYYVLQSPSLADNSVDGSKISMGSDAQGDVLYYDGSNYARLAAGISGQYLRTRGSSANPMWSSNGLSMQITSKVLTGTFSTASTTPVDVTGLDVGIIPTSASSRILIMASVCGSASTAFGRFRLTRDGTAIAVGDAAGSREQASTALGMSSNDQIDCSTITFIDSPGTTSLVSYKIQGWTNTGTLHVNRSTTDTDNSAYARTASSIVAMEIGG